MPNLRFPEFTGEWIKKDFNENLIRLENGATYDANETSGLPMSRIETISGSIIDYSKVGHCSKLKNSEHYKLQYGDILFSHINSLKHIGKTAYYYAEKPLYHGMNLLLLRCNNKIDSKFLFYLVNTNQFIRSCQILAKQAVNQASLSTSDLKRIKIYLPAKGEQQKIARFITLIDKRIATQSKIIEKLQSLMSGIERKIFSLSNKKKLSCKLLGEVCSITTGKLDANAMSEDGKYPFFTCAKIPYKINEYVFDCEALLISGNGANVGYINYYKGKFNAYQRTYILSNFTQNIFYIQFYLNANLHRRIALQKNTGNTPYIILSTLSEMPIYFTSIEEQKEIVSRFQSFYSLLKIEREILTKYKEQKAFLLNQMFI